MPRTIASRISAALNSISSPLLSLHSAHCTPEAKISFEVERGSTIKVEMSPPAHHWRIQRPGNVISKLCSPPMLRQPRCAYGWKHSREATATRKCTCATHTDLTSLERDSTWRCVTVKGRPRSLAMIENTMLLENLRLATLHMISRQYNTSTAPKPCAEVIEHRIPSQDICNCRSRQSTRIRILSSPM